MKKMGVAEFHAGYNIRTFFEKFPELTKFIDIKGYNEILTGAKANIDSETLFVQNLPGRSQ